jgi:hypothetical protein
MADEITETPEETKAPAPTEEAPTGLDALLGTEDDIEQIIATQSTTEAATGEEEAPAAVEEPPLPVVEPPVVEPAPEPVETKPAEEPVEKKETKGPKWSDLRKADRDAREAKDRADKAERELEEFRARERTAETTETGEEEVEDPVSKMAERMEKLEQKQEFDAKQQQVILVQNQIQGQEQSFSKDHPDYQESLVYLVEQAKTEFTHDGSIGRLARNYIATNRAAVEEFAFKNNFVNEETGEPDLDKAAKEAAFRNLTLQRRNAMVENWREEGRNVAKAAYEFAQAKGFKGKTEAPVAPTKAQADARLRVQQAVKTEAASKSLSSVQGGSAPKDWRPTTREEALNLSDEEFDRLEAEDPEWHKKLG